MKTLALIGLGAAVVLCMVRMERRYLCRVAMDPGICLDPPGPTHYVLRSPEWDRRRAAARSDA